MNHIETIKLDESERQRRAGLGCARTRIDRNTAVATVMVAALVLLAGTTAPPARYR